MSLSEYGYVVTTKSGDQSWDVTDYKILHEGSGGGTFSRDSSQAAISYLCEYYFVERFIDTVLGKTVQVGATLSRSATTPTFDDTQGSLPEEHPYYYNFFASSAEVVPMGASEQDPDVGPLWDKAKVVVVFRPPTYNVLGDGDIDTELDRFVSRSGQSQAEFQTSLGFFKFVSSGRPLDITPGQTIAATRFVYTWHQIPAIDRDDGEPDLSAPPNIDTVLPLLGTVNSVAFDGYAPGTVLFSNWDWKLVLPQVATSGNYYWDILYTMGIRDYGVSSTPKVTSENIGWNYAYDPLTGDWGLFTTNGTTGGLTLYPYEDPNALFEVSW